MRESEISRSSCHKPAEYHTKDPYIRGFFMLRARSDRFLPHLLPPLCIIPNISLQLIPVNRRYPLAQLSETLRTHFPRILKPKPKSFSAESSQPSPAAAASHNEAAATLAAAAGKGEKRVKVAEQQLSPTSDDARRELKPTNLDEKGRPRRRGRRKARILAVEYTLLGGVNDSVEDADRLADWLREVACVVNLITFNAHEGTPFSSSSLPASEAFRQALTARGQLCTFRDSRGDDGMAACGWVGIGGLCSVLTYHTKRVIRKKMFIGSLLALLRQTARLIQ